MTEKKFSLAALAAAAQVSKSLDTMPSRRRLSTHLGIDVDAIAQSHVDAMFGKDEPVKLDIPPLAANDDGAPTFYLAPDQFTMTYRVFNTLAACQEFAKRAGSAVLDVIPLVIEHNPELGF